MLFQGRLYFVLKILKALNYTLYYGKILKIKEGSAIMTIGYLITLILAIVLLVLYFVLIKKKEFWLGLLFASVAVVNLGYFLLSLANSTPFAIFANDVAYLGSVFLSACMFLTVVKLCGFKITRAHNIICIVLATAMFLIVALSPVVPLYYKSLELKEVDGITKLVKEYGVLHSTNLVYVLGYFASMIITIIHSVVKKKIGAPKFAALIAGVVCGNIIVWAFEKFISWVFEFLSVTYIISEVVFLMINWMIADYVHIRDIPKITEEEKKQLGIDIKTMPMEEKIGRVLAFLPKGEVLASRERDVLEAVLENKKRKDIALDMHLSENTVKTYTRNLYGKLGVSSREELYSLLLKN
jgi:DNA-binding CsgD family transcriptional regulator